jgi:hypothetical protein
MACEMIIKNPQIPSSLPNNAEAGKSSGRTAPLFGSSHPLGSECVIE